MTLAQNKRHFVIVDDDKQTGEVHARLIQKAGHDVTVFSSSTEALAKIPDILPDCILCDLIMPDLDGLELFQQIRKNPQCANIRFIVLTGKIFEFDKRRAYELGVDGYLTKPVDPATFIEDIVEIMDKNFVVQFWGVRGTLPVPGKNTLKYGGNTNCVSLRFGPKHLFIFDAGTGIRELSNHLVEKNKFPLSAKLFITHPHYDHINGIPFFAPFYMQGNEFEILGTSHYGMSIEKLIADQMDGVYFPVTIKEFAAKITYRNLTEESFFIDDLEIKTIFLNHPGKCLGYKVCYQDKSFSYITDNELYLPNSAQFNQFEFDRLLKFIEDTDILIIDATYKDEDYVDRFGWGHSSVTRVVDLAHRARVKLLCLFHHDPEQLDADIDKKIEIAHTTLKKLNSQTQCIAPKEGETFILETKK